MNKHCRQEVLDAWELPENAVFEKVNEGVDNTTYSIQTAKDRYALTILRNTSQNQMHAVLTFIEKLQAGKIHIPTPQSVRQNKEHQSKYIATLSNEYAVLNSWMNGSVLSIINDNHCFDLGHSIGNLHSHSKVVEGLDRAIFDQVMDLTVQNLTDMDANAIELLDWSASLWQEIDTSHLTFGFCHTDLFRDNILFENDRVSGIIDFNSAANSFHIYDVATLILDFCYLHESLLFSESHISALLEGYNSAPNIQLIDYSLVHKATAFVGMCVMLKRYDRKRHGDVLPAHRQPTEMATRLQALKNQQLIIS